MDENRTQLTQTEPAPHIYNDVVLYRVKGVMVKALVIQSQIVPIPDRSAPGGTRNEEHLNLLYLDPTSGRPVMSQAEVENAITRQHGVAPVSERNHAGWFPIEDIRVKGFIPPESGQQNGAVDHGEGEKMQEGELQRT